MSRLGSLGHKLYTGEVSYDIVGLRRRWYAISAAVVVIALGSLLLRGLNLGIEFRGGAEFQAPSASCDIASAREAVASVGTEPVTVTALGNSLVRITTEAVDNERGNEIRAALAEACDVTIDDVSAQLVGPTWGGEITKKALWALAWFLGLLAVFLAIYFDWRMAIAALVALVHDILITVGVYSVLHFEVTPSTVIGILTILGYSLYDTVVVFDKVKENTRGILGQSRQTYSQAANLAVNQTLVRSINTSVVALLPVAAILFVGAGILGAGTLKDLSLALFVGIAAGTYSSVFIATPLLAQLMERDPRMQALAKRVLARGTGARGGRGPAEAPAPSGPVPGRPGQRQGRAATPESRGGEVAVADSPEEQALASGPVPDVGDDAMDRARARRASAGPRQQPKRSPRAKRR